MRSIRAADMPEISKIIVIDNFGDVRPNGQSIVIKPGRNLGWTSALVEGLKYCDSEFVVFLNDDTEFERRPENLTLMLEHFDDESVGVVGPATGIALGAQSVGGPDIEEVKLLIGFCQVVRRSALEKIGGLDESFNIGGDDLDMSIRMADHGYKLILDRRVFVYHHAFKTGQRLYGKANVPGGWNSIEMATGVYDRISEKYGPKRLLGLIEIQKHQETKI